MFRSIYNVYVEFNIAHPPADASRILWIWVLLSFYSEILGILPISFFVKLSQVLGDP